MYRAMYRFIRPPYLIIPRPQKARIVVVSCIESLMEGLRNGSEAVHHRGVRWITTDDVAKNKMPERSGIFPMA
jgi:hypothetical protein